MQSVAALRLRRHHVQACAYACCDGSTRTTAAVKSCSVARAWLAHVAPRMPLCDLQSTQHHAQATQSQLVAAHDQVVHRHERWKSKERGKLDQRAEALEAERSALARQRDELRLREKQFEEHRDRQTSRVASQMSRVIGGGAQRVGIARSVASVLGRICIP